MSSKESLQNVHLSSLFFFELFKASSSTVVSSFVQIFWLVGVIVEDALEDHKTIVFQAINNQTLICQYRINFF